MITERLKKALIEKSNEIDKILAESRELVFEFKIAESDFIKIKKARFPNFSITIDTKKINTKIQGATIVLINKVKNYDLKQCLDMYEQLKNAYYLSKKSCNKININLATFNMLAKIAEMFYSEEDYLDEELNRPSIDDFKKAFEEFVFCKKFLKLNLHSASLINEIFKEYIENGRLEVKSVAGVNKSFIIEELKREFLEKETEDAYTL